MAKDFARTLAAQALNTEYKHHITLN